MSPRAGEQAWTVDDVEYALEWQAMQDEQCSGCGQPRHESFDPVNAMNYETEMHRCFACAEKADRLSSVRSGDGNTSGVYVTTHRVRDDG